MQSPRLRVFYGPESPAAVTPRAKPGCDKITLPLGEIFPILAEAVTDERAWLRDFEDDEITISNDLYELIVAYQHYHRPSA